MIKIIKALNFFNALLLFTISIFLKYLVLGKMLKL